jgi:hypothetical protein
MFFWATHRNVKLHFIEPGKPTQNAFVERVNGKFRDYCLDLHWFASLDVAKRTIEQWRMHYNHVRLHRSLRRKPPVVFAQQAASYAQTATSKLARIRGYGQILGNGHRSAIKHHDPMWWRGLLTSDPLGKSATPTMSRRSSPNRHPLLHCGETGWFQRGRLGEVSIQIAVRKSSAWRPSYALQYRKEDARSVCLAPTKKLTSDIRAYMHLLANAWRKLLLSAAMLICSTSLSVAPLHAAHTDAAPIHAGPVQAQFRGCDSAGWCRFWIDSLGGAPPALYRVYLDGIARSSDEVYSIAVRDRLNALLANMIHQYKRIKLHGLRDVGEGFFAAVIIVNGNDVASDPILLELQEKIVSNTR